MSDDLQAIVRGLSAGQRFALLSPDPKDIVGSDDALRGLAEKNLAWFRAADIDLLTGQRRLMRWQLRTQGLRVRALLQDKD